MCDSIQYATATDGVYVTQTVPTVTVRTATDRRTYQNIAFDKH